MFGNNYTWSVVLGPDMVVKYSAEGEVNSNIIQNILVEYNLTEEIMLGDQNYDGLVNILDVVQLVNLILDGGYEDIGDLNNDGVTNIQDIILIINIILN
tara:strand:- start:139 stop:435 length:297 start_codon:yes stop_codon:yes gene_type:complete